jgi:hypothetical protein
MSLTWRTYAANEPRFVGTDRALLMGPGGTNLTNRPVGTGGTPGTPGALPSGITLTGTNVTLGASVTASGVFGGVPWEEYEFVASAAATCRINFAQPSIADTLPYRGQVFAAWPGAQPGIVTSTSLRMTGVVTPLQSVTLPPNGEVGRVTGAWVANTTGASVFQLEIQTSGAGTFRVRFGWNDFKQQSFLSNPIIAASGPAAIGADLLTFPLAPLGIGPSGTFWWDHTFLPTSGAEHIFGVDDASTNNRYLISRSAGGTLAFTRTNAGAGSSSNIFTPTNDTRYGIAATIRGDGTARVKVQGQTAVEVSGGPVAGLTTLRLNGNSSSGFVGQSLRRRIAYLPYAVSDAQLDQFAADAAAW